MSKKTVEKFDLAPLFKQKKAATPGGRCSQSAQGGGQETSMEYRIRSATLAAFDVALFALLETNNR